MALIKDASVSEPPPMDSASAVASGVSVTVEPAPLSIIEPPASVRVCRQGSRFAGVIRALRVADPRSTDAGWKLRMTTAAGPATVVVRRVEAFALTIRGIAPSPPTVAEAGRSAVLLTALPGSGAGAFDVWIVVSVELPGVHGDTTNVGVSFDLS